MKNNLVKSHWFFLSLLAAISGSGTFPYGYQFAFTYFPHVGHSTQIAMGIFFGLIAAGLNMILGLYALLHLKESEKSKATIFILFFAAIATIPTAFICFYGYKDILPIVINIPLSMIVYLVNAGINNYGLSTLIGKLMKSPDKLLQPVLPSLIGILIGTFMSIISYLAAHVGLHNLFEKSAWISSFDLDFAAFIAFFSWIPAAALFANANQEASVKAYTGMKDLLSFKKKPSWTGILILLLCLASGTAYAQITHYFYDPSQPILAIFKHEAIQAIVHPYIEILAVLSSAMLNYIALHNLLNQ